MIENRNDNINEIEQAVQLQEKIFTLFKGTEAENVFEILERKPKVEFLFLNGLDRYSNA